MTLACAAVLAMHPSAPCVQESRRHEVLLDHGLSACVDVLVLSGMLCLSEHRLVAVVCPVTPANPGYSHFALAEMAGPGRLALSVVTIVEAAP